MMNFWKRFLKLNNKNMRYLFAGEIEKYNNEVIKLKLNPIECFYIPTYEELQLLKEIYKKQNIDYTIIRINQPKIEI